MKPLQERLWDRKVAQAPALRGRGRRGEVVLGDPPFPNARLGSQFLSHKHSDADTKEGKDGTSKGLA